MCACRHMICTVLPVATLHFGAVVQIAVAFGLRPTGHPTVLLHLSHVCIPGFSEHKPRGLMFDAEGGYQENARTNYMPQGLWSENPGNHYYAHSKVNPLLLSLLIQMFLNLRHSCKVSQSNYAKAVECQNDRYSKSRNHEWKLQFMYDNGIDS